MKQNKRQGDDAATTSTDSFIELLAGAVGGMCGKLIDYPADTVKTKLQTETNRSSRGGAFRCAMNTWKNSGFTGFYHGLPTPLLGAMSESAVMFSSWASSCRWLSGGVDPGRVSMPVVCAAGSLSGVAIAAILTPLELVKCQMQNRVTAARYHSSWHCVHSLLYTQGVSGLYRGHASTLVRECPSLAVYFGSYEYIMRRFDPQRISSATILGAGSIAGILCWASTFPADVVKSRQQTGHTGNFSSIAKYVFARYGLRGLYRGLGITILRAVPANAAIFVTYEAIVRSYSHRD